MKTFFKSTVLCLLFFCSVFFPSLEAAKQEITVKDMLKDFHILTNDTCDSLQEFKRFEKIIEKFLKEKKITGATIAISKGERLVYAKGFGYTTAEKEEKVQPYHLFRVASVSKLFTAVAIMKLVSEKKLSLDKAVFGTKGYLSEYKVGRDRNINKITIKHLLEHSGGWDSKLNDPMFNPIQIAKMMKAPAPASMETIIKYMLKNKLSHKPGEHYHYSNFGYALLGEIIEKASGRTYEGFVQNEILNPIGVHFTKLGNTLSEDKDILEVAYNEIGSSKMRSIYDQSLMVSPIYGGFDMKNLAAAGGWISSAADILRLVTAIDGNPTRKDILPSELTLEMPTMMHTPFYRKWSYGWAAAYGEKWWRTGSLRGTSARVVRGPNGISWAIIVNTNDWQISHLAKEIDPVMQKAMATIESYPEQDLF